MSVLIQNGTIVTAHDRWRGDVLCIGGKIAALGPALDPPAGVEVIDAGDQLVLPGGVDPHVHMQLPVSGTVSSDDFESGTIAALAGGTTTIIDFVHPERGQDYFEALQARRTEAIKSVIDYSFHMAVTWMGDGVEAAIRRCVTEEGIPTFKAYLAYRPTVGIDDADLIRAMKIIGSADGMLLVHAEHGDMAEALREELANSGQTGPAAHPRSRPPLVEAEATHRACVLSSLCNCPLYVVHVTCKESMREIARARRRGWRVHGETCPQYLLLDDRVYERDGFEAANFVMSPPIRSLGHQDALWGALRGDVLEVVATDHCPFTMKQKRMGEDDFRNLPNGAAGVEHRLSLLFTHGVGGGRIDLHRFVDLVSTRPAKLFGLYPRKGAIAVGSDADLVVWDQNASGIISADSDHHNCDRSIYEGFEITGKPSYVVAGGTVQLRAGSLCISTTGGRFLPRGLPS